MRKLTLLLSLLAVTLLVTSSNAAAAKPAPFKAKGPAVVGAMTSLANLDRDCQDAIKVFNDPRMKMGYAFVKSMAPSFLKGIDTKRPFGMVLTHDGDELRGYVAIPIANFKEYEAGLPKAYLSVCKKEKGYFVLKGKSDHDKMVYGKPFGNWVLYSQRKADLPATMKEFIPQIRTFFKLTEDYDFAATLHLNNVPPSKKGKLIAKLYADAARCRVKVAGRFGDAAEKIGYTKAAGMNWFKGIQETMIAKMKTVILDTQSIHLGYRFSNGQVQVAATVKARPGSPTAAKMATVGTERSWFNGFLQDNNVGTFQFGCECKCLTDTQWKELFDGLRKTAELKIDAKYEDKVHAGVKMRNCEYWIDAIEGYILTGKHEGVCGLRTFPRGGGCFVAARYTEQCKDFEKAIFDSLDYLSLKKYGGKKCFYEKNVGYVNGVRLHTMTFDIPDKMPQDAKGRMARWFGGRKMTLCLGVGRSTMYVACGKDAFGQLAKALAKARPCTLQTAQLKFNALELAKFTAMYGRSEWKRDVAIEVLKKADKRLASRCDVTMAILPTEDKCGATFLANLDAGALQMMGVAHKMKRDWYKAKGHSWHGHCPWGRPQAAAPKCCPKAGDAKGCPKAGAPKCCPKAGDAKCCAKAGDCKCAGKGDCKGGKAGACKGCPKAGTCKCAKAAAPKGCPKAGDAKSCPKAGDAKSCPKAGDAKSCPKAGDAKSCPKAGDAKSCPKAAVKKPAPKKAAVKKPAPKKAEAKKPAPKKAAVKKPAPKKAEVKKPAPKKSRAKKPAPEK